MLTDGAVYERDSGRRVADVTPDELPPSPGAADRFLWLELVEPGADELGRVASALGLHELAVEDAVHAHQRPKLEEYGDTLLLVLKTARRDAVSGDVAHGEVLAFLRHDFLVVVRHGGAARLDASARRLDPMPEQVRDGPAGILHGLVDQVVDDYGPVIAALEDAIAEIEDLTFSDSSPSPVERIYLLDRQLLGVHRQLAPLLDPLAALASRPFPQVPEGVRHYFRDAEDHLLRVTEQSAANRELLSSILQANLTQVSVRQNEDMRKISAWAAIAAVPTVATGVYGMNFEHMPELGARFGYPVVLVVLAAVCAVLYRVFRRSGWL